MNFFSIPAAESSARKINVELVVLGILWDVGGPECTICCFLRKVETMHTTERDFNKSQKFIC